MKWSVHIWLIHYLVFGNHTHWNMYRKLGAKPNKDKLMKNIQFFFSGKKRAEDKNIFIIFFGPSLATAIPSNMFTKVFCTQIFTVTQVSHSILLSQKWNKQNPGNGLSLFAWFVWLSHSNGNEANIKCVIIEQREKERDRRVERKEASFSWYYHTVNTQNHTGE